MKKVLIAVLAFMLSSFVTASAAKFDDKDEMNIVYLGGSITAGVGLTEGNSWATNVGNWFTETYDDTTVNNFNVGAGGTGSDYGFYRLGEEVISKDPDVVFVEFAVNDMYSKDEEAQIYMDGIVQSLQKLEEPPYIVFIFTAAQDYDNRVDASEYHKAVAEYYKIPYIDLQTDALEPFVAKGEDITTLFADAVHPSDAGYQLYTDCILEKLKTEGFLKKSVIKETNFVKATYGNKGIDFYAPRHEAISDASYTTTGTWGVNGSRIYTEEAGATLTYKFYGPAIGINSIYLKNGAKVQCEIDGVPVNVIDSYTTSSYRMLAFSKSDLYDKEHTLKITVLDEVNAGNTTGGKKFDISGFYVSDGYIDDIGKLAVYDPVIRSIEGQEIKIVEAKVSNIGNTDINALCLLAKYDAQGNLIGVNRVKETFIANNVGVFGMGTIMSDIQDLGCKLFIWNESGIPLYKGTIIE